MNSRHRYLALAVAILLSGYGVAQAQGINAGSYKLAIGSAAACALDLAADGSAKVDTACARADLIHKWRATPSGFELEDGSGAVYANLVAKGDGYAGKTFTDFHTVVVTPTSQTAGLAH